MVDSIPSDELVEQIAVAKIKAIEVSTDLWNKLEQEVGSYGLMLGAGFEHRSILLCCKFAEGDSRILLQKLARDRLKELQHSSWVSILGKILAGTREESMETLAAMSLARSLQSSINALPTKGRKDPVGLFKAWNDNYDKVYALAECVCERHLQSVACMEAQSQPNSRL